MPDHLAMEEELGLELKRTLEKTPIRKGEVSAGRRLREELHPCKGQVGGSGLSRPVSAGGAWGGSPLCPRWGQGVTFSFTCPAYMKAFMR